ncbi:hypothetical protein GGTG_09310 [Gaeumannomyces tritici R3-111a-1]|uniref:Enoyl reductase (ER) domain-containing protein n=1 Tax=Gaeumannomyces tritici (strain R3-111a-1) TaxID=644352 RepID=J3P713_GAET3|nr:hypothetical protein GGTG_09310 [Gaeumannomyces tritici R3-111a-1]EJT72444.1 hypothetical protein GGTG_09310 [Gaeumannomyces tritici R3-111a-1]
MPGASGKVDTAAAAAARQYHQTAQAFQRRASLSRQATSAKTRVREALRAFCRRVDLPYSSVHRHYKAILSTGHPAVSERPQGRPPSLTGAEDAVLLAYVAGLERAGVVVSGRMVVARANELRSLRTPPAGPVDKNWHARWRQDSDGALRAATARLAGSSRMRFSSRSMPSRSTIAIPKVSISGGLRINNAHAGHKLTRGTTGVTQTHKVANGIYKSHHKSLAESTPSPIAPCSDMCGVVVAVGPTPSPTWQVGDRVVPTFIPGFASGQVLGPQLAASLGFPAGGVLQTHRVFPTAGLVRAPAHLSDGEAACLPVAALTAWMALFWEAPLGAAAQRGLKGRTVLVQGTGGVSVCGPQIAKASGATVIVTSSSDAKLERAKALGADHGSTTRPRASGGVRCYG